MRTTTTTTIYIRHREVFLAGSASSEGVYYCPHCNGELPENYAAVGNHADVIECRLDPSQVDKNVLIERKRK